MKQLIVFVLLLLGTSAWAEWTRVGDTDTFVVYADMATIRRKGINMVNMWALFDYKSAQSSSSTGQAPLSAKAQSEYDCDGERHRILFFSWHSGNMGHGKTLYSSEEYLGTWTPVSPDSHGKMLWKIACKQ